MNLGKIKIWWDCSVLNRNLNMVVKYFNDRYKVLDTVKGVII